MSRKLWNALRWTTSTYCMILLILLFVAFAAFVVGAVWTFLKRILVEKPEAKKDAAPVPIPSAPYPSAQPPVPQEKPDESSDS